MAGPVPVRGPLSWQVARLVGPAVFLLADAFGKDAEGWPKSIRHRYGSGHVVSRPIWLGLAKSGCVGPSFGPGLPDLPIEEIQV